MAKLKRSAKRTSTTRQDEHGGFADGGLAILDPEGNRLHVTPARVANALRYFLARVEFHDQGMPERLAVTSALAGEGVTFVTRSLGAVLAYDTLSSVAVVDFNWRRPPREGEAEGDPQPPGLADAVEGGASIDDIVRPTSNPRLALVPAGAVALARRPALSVSRELAVVLDELNERFDFLFFDLPPVLATTEAMNLTQVADAFTLVVRQGVTSESQVEAALDEMQGSIALGAILNRYDSRIPRRLRRLVGT